MSLATETGNHAKLQSYLEGKNKTANMSDFRRSIQTPNPWTFNVMTRWRDWARADLGFKQARVDVVDIYIVCEKPGVRECTTIYGDGCVTDAMVYKDLNDIAVSSVVFQYSLQFDVEQRIEEAATPVGLECLTGNLMDILTENITNPKIRQTISDRATRVSSRRAPSPESDSGDDDLDDTDFLTEIDEQNEYGMFDYDEDEDETDEEDED